MLDGVSIDQLRTFLAAADEGSFSAAGRRLGRAQSVVSQTLANLEGQLGVKLFERSGRYPVLTDHGRALLADARAVDQGFAGFKARARALAGGLEPELTVCIDVMFPMHVLTHAVRGFGQRFPDTPLRIEVEVLGAVLQPLMEERCAFSVMGSLPDIPEHYAQEPLISIPFVLVSASDHSLARLRRRLKPEDVADHVQIVLSDRSRLSEGRQFCVFANKIWRVADLGAKHAFIRGGLGWGGMPLHMVQEDLEKGHLARLNVTTFPKDMMMPMRAVHRKDRPPGPAGRWLIDQLKETVSLCPQEHQPGAAAE